MADGDSGFLIYPKSQGEEENDRIRKKDFDTMLHAQ